MCGKLTTDFGMKKSLSDMRFWYTQASPYFRSLHKILLHMQMNIRLYTIPK